MVLDELLREGNKYMWAGFRNSRTLGFIIFAVILLAKLVEWEFL